jgi:DNA-binding Lrp family transcriptional regulator
MKEVAKNGEKRMTVKEVAEQLSCSCETVKKHIRKLFPNLMKERATTYLTEEQVTVVLERMKVSNSHFNNRTDNARVASSETAMSDEFRLAMLYKQDAEIMRQAAELERKLHIKTKTKLLKTETRLRETECRLGQEVIAHDRTKNGLATYQRIAESAGLVKSDRDDVLDTYRR